MKIGVIADDFTGASDIALMLRSNGMDARQFVGVPTIDSPNIDAGVISLKSRTCPVEEAVENSLKACDWLLKQGAEQIILKICSTFDSTPEGNIGPVAEALAERLGEDVVLVCPAFPANGRSVFQAHLFVGDTLLSQSGMQNHPLTPMTQSDLRKVLAPQTSWQVGHIPFSVVSQGANEIRKALPKTKQMVIIDAIQNQDLMEIGSAASGLKLLVGGSGIAMGLPANFGTGVQLNAWQGRQGKALILSGSCSIATRRQVELYKQMAGDSVLELKADQMIVGAYAAKEIANWALAQDIAPLVFSSADPEVVKKAQAEFGRDEIASAFEQFFSQLARAFVDAGGERLIVAGGETSGAVVEGLNVSAMDVGPEIAPGVPALDVVGTDVVLALKSGNFGAPDFFAHALTVLGGDNERSQ